MIKIAGLLLVIFSHFGAISQVYGDIMLDQRKVANEMDYTIPYSREGKIVFDIAVDMDGKVTSCVLNEEKSTITNTGAVMKAKNKIIMQLSFERGYHWPKFHYGFVQIKTIQGEVEKENEFLPPPQ